MTKSTKILWISAFIMGLFLGGYWNYPLFRTDKTRLDENKAGSANAFTYPGRLDSLLYGFQTTRVHTYAAGDIVASADLNAIQDGMISVSTGFIDHNRFAYGNGWVTNADGTTSNNWIISAMTTGGNMNGLMTVNFCWGNNSTGGKLARLENSADGSTWYNVASTQSISISTEANYATFNMRQFSISWAGDFSSVNTVFRLQTDTGTVMASNSAQYSYFLHGRAP